MTTNSSSPPALVHSAADYAGDIAPALAWQWLQAGHAVLLDVRTDAERAWVGYVPGARAAAWLHWPGMQPNPDFDEELRAAVPPGGRVALLCRSGVRSAAAARRAAALGFEAYNVCEGFEGQANALGQHGQINGWRVRGLPWRQ